MLLLLTCQPKICEICDQDFYPTRNHHWMCPPCGEAFGANFAYFAWWRKRRWSENVYGMHCTYCRRLTVNGFQSKPGRSWRHIDHRMPKSKGGTNTMDNKQVLCRTCNLWKHARTEAELIALDPVHTIRIGEA